MPSPGRPPFVATTCWTGNRARARCWPRGRTTSNSAATRVRGGDLGGRWGLRAGRPRQVDAGHAVDAHQLVPAHGAERRADPVRGHARQLRHHQLHRHAEEPHQLRRHVGHGVVQRQHRPQLRRQLRERDEAGETCANNLADGSPAPSADCRIASFYSIDLRPLAAERSRSRCLPRSRTCSTGRPRSIP